MTRENKKFEPAVDNEPFLLEELKDPEFASGFLNHAIEEFLEDGDIQSFNAMLGYLIKTGNVSQIAKDCGMSRSQIYRMTNGTCEPSLVKTFKLLQAIGFQFKVEPIDKSA